MSGTSTPGELQELRAPATQYSSLVVPWVTFGALWDFLSTGCVRPLQLPGLRLMPTSPLVDVARDWDFALHVCSAHFYCMSFPSVYNLCATLLAYWGRIPY